MRTSEPHNSHAHNLKCKLAHANVKTETLLYEPKSSKTISLRKFPRTKRPWLHPRPSEHLSLRFTKKGPQMKTATWVLDSLHFRHIHSVILTQQAHFKQSTIINPSN